MLFFKSRFLSLGIIFIFIVTFANGQDDDDGAGRNAGADDLSERYQYHAIMAINTIRAEHESESLVMSDELNQVAIKCAKLHMRHRLKLKLPGEPDCDIDVTRNGEKVTPGKILFHRGRNFTGKTDEDIVKYNMEDWGSYGELYWENDKVRTNSTDKFTMMVWNATDEAGYGCNDYWPPLFCIGLFYPAGNIDGKFDENVFPNSES